MAASAAGTDFRGRRNAGLFAFDLWYFSLPALAALLLLTLNRTGKQACAIGFAWGLGLFGSGVNWVYVSIADFGGMPEIANLFLVVLLAAYLALYPMLFAGLLAKCFPHATVWRLVIAAPHSGSLLNFTRLGADRLPVAGIRLYPD